MYIKFWVKTSIMTGRKQLKFFASSCQQAKEINGICGHYLGSDCANYVYSNAENFSSVLTVRKFHHLYIAMHILK